GPIVFAREHASRASRDHAADLLESLVPIHILERLSLAHACKPARKLAPARLAPRWHADGLDEFTVREKSGFLVLPLEAIGVVQIARVLREIRRLGAIEDFAV